MLIEPPFALMFPIVMLPDFSVAPSVIFSAEIFIEPFCVVAFVNLILPLCELTTIPSPFVSWAFAKIEPLFCSMLLVAFTFM